MGIVRMHVKYRYILIVTVYINGEDGVEGIEVHDRAIRKMNMFLYILFMWWRTLLFVRIFISIDLNEAECDT